MKKLITLFILFFGLVSPRLFGQNNNPVINIYPNPFEGITTIEINLGDENQNSFLIVTDITGKEIIKIPVTQKSVKFPLQINVASKGIYIASLYNKGKPVDVIKLVIY